MSEHESAELEAQESGDDFAMEPKTLKLRKPIHLGQRVVDQLTFRPPCGKDFRRLVRRPGEEIDFVLTLAGRLCGEIPQVMDKLEGADLMEVLAIAGGFIGGGLGDGSEPSA